MHTWARVVVVNAGFGGVTNRVYQWQKSPSLSPWQCYTVPPSLSQFPLAYVSVAQYAITKARVSVCGIFNLF